MPDYERPRWPLMGAHSARYNLRTNIMKQQTKAQRQARYLAEFNDAVIALDPSKSGRIDWPTALHFYFTGVPVADAAARYLDNGAEGESK